MSANINSETGIRYGVIQAHSVPLLYDEIYSCGTDESYLAWKKDRIAELLSLLQTKDADELANYICEHGRREKARVTAEEIIKDLDDSEPTNDDAEAVFDNLDLNEQFECDESEYSYEDKEGNQFLIGYLGGAPLIWCIKTNRVVHVKSLCSPCVPNAGDLDSGLTDDESGYACYGVPTEYEGDE